MLRVYQIYHKKEKQIFTNDNLDNLQSFTFGSYVAKFALFSNMYLIVYVYFCIRKRTSCSQWNENFLVYGMILSLKPQRHNLLEFRSIFLQLLHRADINFACSARIHSGCGSTRFLIECQIEQPTYIQFDLQQLTLATGRKASTEIQNHCIARICSYPVLMTRLQKYFPMRCNAHDEKKFFLSIVIKQ